MSHDDWIDASSEAVRLRAMAVLSRVAYRFSWWHQGMFLFDRAYAFESDWGEYEEATDGGPVIGQSRSRGVTFISPGGSLYGAEDAALTVEIYDSEPEPEANAETLGEFDVDAVTGDLVLEVSGGGDESTTVGIPAGSWRARWHGFGEREAQEAELLDPPPATRPDRYLLQFWPRASDRAVTILVSSENA